MALLAQCTGCQTAVVVSNLSEADSAVVCPPDSPCCKQDHHHGQAANACPRGHEGAACPAPDSCRVFDGDGCAGGHCGVGVDGCTVCRPLHLTLLAPPPSEAPNVTVGEVA